MNFRSYEEYTDYTQAFNYGLSALLKPETLTLKSEQLLANLNSKMSQRALRKTRSLKFLAYRKNEWWLVSSFKEQQTNTSITLSGVKRLLGDYFEWLSIYPPEVVCVVYNLWLLDDVLENIKYFSEVGDLANPTSSILLIKENHRVLADCLYNALSGRYVASSQCKVGVKVGMELFSYEVSSVPMYDNQSWEAIEVTNSYLGLLVNFANLKINPPTLFVRAL